MFLKDCWYVGACSTELGARPFARRILDEPVVFFRTTDGRAVALHDRCAHRGAPLSIGTVRGAEIECGYHGFRYGPDGQCAFMPGHHSVAADVAVRAYPVIERWGWIFVWMGDPARTDPARVPDYHWIGDPDWAGKGDLLWVGASYTLVRDNLLDLTHAKYVHKQTLATDAVTEFPVTARIEGDRIRVERFMPRIAASPFFAALGGYTCPVDHRQMIELEPPASIVISVCVASAAGSGENIATEFRVINALTPETMRSTHYFWSLQRNFARDDAALNDRMYQMNRDTFLEDVLVLERQQERIDGDRGWAGLITPADQGIVLADRVLRRLIENERRGFSAVASASDGPRG